MGAIKLHTFNPMDHGFRVRWLLAELNVDYESVHDEFEHVLSDQYINPFNRIPVIEYEGQVMYESSAICWWLAERYNSELLLPSSDNNYASMLQWIFIGSTNFDSAVMDFAIASRDKYAAVVIAEKKEVIKPYLNSMEEHFSTNKWVLGNKFTLPDIILAYLLGMVSIFGVLEGYSSLRRYIGDFLQRPAINKMPGIKGMWRY